MSVTGYDVDMRRALTGLHALTGCDWVRAYFRQRKIKGFRLLESKVSFLFRKFAFTSKISVKCLLEIILKDFNFSKKKKLSDSLVTVKSNYFSQF